MLAEPLSWIARIRRSRGKFCFTPTTICEISCSMTPSARLQAVIDIFEQLRATGQPADRLVREWARGHRFAGSKDRAAIAEHVFNLLRHRFSFAWRMQSEGGRAAVIASLLADGRSAELDALFDGSRYAPSPLTEHEKATISSPPPGPVPLSVQGEFPEFLLSEFQRAFGENLLAETTALATRAPIDLRVNLLKARRDDVFMQLRTEGYDAAPTRFSPHGIRIPSAAGLSSLGRAALFESGAFEFQDEAAQITSLLAGAKPGEHVLDLAAGAGGKSLALAAEMGNRGEIVACDIDGRRLAALEPRATRAGVSIIRTHVLRGPAPEGSFDLVFVDAPCSGTGVWRRQPELRMRLSEGRLAELVAIQDRLLDQAAACVRTGGRLVYATCSLLPRENEDRVAAFRSRHPRFRIQNAGHLWRETGASTGLSSPDDFFHASPYVTGTDGFFAGVFVLSET
jgi:16S rRNA (cytosine967-C5)-methyltransferase